MHIDSADILNSRHEEPSTVTARDQKNINNDQNKKLIEDYTLISIRKKWKICQNGIKMFNIFE